MRNIKRNNKTLSYIVLCTIYYFINSNSFAQQLYPASFDTTTLNGINGFRIPGIDPESQFGAETTFIGDINSDGFEDIGIGVNNADIDGLDLAGAAYIIFGTNVGFPATFDITTLDGTNGFVVKGIVGSTRMGSSVEGVGDINGDSIDDLIIRASGIALVIYGKPIGDPFDAESNINDINGINGFRIEMRGSEIRALGDVNGDGRNDFVIGHPSFFSVSAGIVFGRSENFPLSIDLSWLDGINGFRTSSFSSSRAGFKVGGAGDINQDGYNDIIIGEWSSGGTLATGGQRTRLLYGRASFDPLEDLNTLDGTNGFAIDNSGGGFLVFTGTLGDINSDGVDDFFSEQSAIFGKERTEPRFPSYIPLSSIEDNTLGFRIPGFLTSASVGDVNKDGINDFIACYGGRGLDHDAYVIFGSTTGFPDPIDESTLDGTNGFVIPGLRTSNIGRPVSGDGDVNGDGIADFIVGSPNEIPEGSTERTGEAYVIFGGDHYAIPLNTGYPQAIDETISGFTLVVNGPETGTIHYVVYPGNFSGTPDHDNILNGTGATTNGNFLMNIANTDVEETISSLAAGTTYDVYLFLEDGVGNQGEIYHIDNVRTLSPTPTVTLSVSSNTGTEAAGTVITVTATSSAAVVGAQTIDLATTGTGITSSDFILSNATIAITDGMTTGTVTFTIVDDALVEGTETATLTISNPSTGITLGTTTAQDVVITDNDSAPIPTVSLSVSSNTGTEAAGTVITVTATSSAAVVGAQTIDLAATGVGITASDFTLSNSTITIPDGMTAGTVTFTVVDDTVVEGTETATLTISNPSTGITLGTTTTQDIVITDNDSAPIPTVSLSVSSNTGTEAAGTVITVTATSSAAVVGAQTIDLATTGVGITASDFTLSNATITIPDGMTTGTVSFTVLDDALVEGTETATLTISNLSTGIALGTTTTQDVVITDNDSASIPTVNLSVSSNAGTESAGTVITVTATSSSAVVGAQTIDLATTGTGITASDFTLSNTTITIPDGMTTGTVTFTVLDDALVEGTETATLTISNPSTGIVLGTTTTQDVVITDNDSAPIPTVNLSVSTDTGTEAAGTVITVTATSSIAVVGAQTIDIAATGVGITASDFALSNTTITIPDGMTTSTVTFTIVDDALVEGTETATLTISNPSTGITLGTTTAQDVVIEDNDDLVICTIKAGEDQEITQGQEIQLNAIASDNGTYVWTPSTGLTNANIANPVASPNQTTTYTVLFTSDQGCIEEDTVTIYVEAQPEDQTRYGFSPDGDGINEYWEIYNIENYPDNKVLIYNRWGDIVFEVEGYNNTSRVFRGIANRKRSLGGDKLPEGTYFFNIKIEGSHNLKKQTGFLVLKR
ncbi:gliding motility-associated-like protein [Aquimarina sp. MAR_2010_214]|uniref:Calx-beta domain-containing protein n=1 Tax=Aquimarina sp. MAR_2010_214 TaxID=1250026 RepID=UPI000C709068|nr:gliding motility-associated C-terminal domain-containing protein [Aquimarina sp. MAR_2010_214]PKV49898.1 gliding motility-associated-like protein [Aquimarina sp. MAR_2010_214]